MAEPDREADTELLAEVAAGRPEVVFLARLASVASIVEPALLRRLRRLLLPAVDAGIEADLWFSPLTHVASATAWTMRTEIAAVLRAQLADPQYEQQRSAARAIVVEAHAGHSDMLQLEDTIIWESICGHDRGVERAFSRALVTLDTSPEIAADVVRWFGQAQRRLPPATLASPPAQRLAAVAALHADRVVPDSIVSGSSFPDGLGAAAPATLPTTDIAVELVPEGLRFSAPAPGDSAILAVPATRPLLVEAGWRTPDGALHTLVTRADPGATSVLPELGSEVVLRTLAGTRFRLRSVETRLTVDHALTMLQSLALAFHMRRFLDEESSDERTERDVLALSDDQSWARYQHVRTMCEYFTQPIRAFLEGGENPLWRPDPAPIKGIPTPVGFSALSQFPGIAGTGLTWPTFHAYVEWLVGMLRSYLATILQRLGPRLVHVGFAVTTDAWESLRRHGDPAALPAENREPMTSAWSKADEPQRYTYDVERAGVPLLIDVLLPPILDAIALAESERPPHTPAVPDEAPVTKVDVFMSFAGTDGRETAEALAERLMSVDVSVAYVTYDILAGDWRREVASRIDECRFFVPILTPRYLSSEWAKVEIDHAFATGRGTDVLPVLHGVSVRAVGGLDERLAYRSALDTKSNPIPKIGEAIAALVRANATGGTPARNAEPRS